MHNNIKNKKIFIFIKGIETSTFITIVTENIINEARLTTNYWDLGCNGKI